jgi:glycosyltransferase involved in cell wall biosynthesis
VTAGRYHDAACGGCIRSGGVRGLRSRPVRLAVFTDYVYHRRGDELYAERAFALFLARLGNHLDRLTLIGRVAPEPARAPYRLPPEVRFVPLPYYPSLGQPSKGIRTLRGAMARFWGALDDVDGVWLLGPHPFGIPFAAIAAIRRKRVVLGVRQDFPSYLRGRHPDRPILRLLGVALEAAYRVLARRFAIVVVGPDLAKRYRHARRLLEINVSLVDRRDVVDPAAANIRSYDGELRLLSVGRLEAEKNPLLLAEVLSRLTADGRRWRLLVCGEGPLRDALELRLRDLGLAGCAELRGYVPFGKDLLDLYRQSHALLHVSWTEGLPQVLLEAFAAATPVVATDVGGVGEAVEGAALLVPPGDPEAAAVAVRAVVDDHALRERLVQVGHRYALAHTAEAETRRLAEYLRGVLR